MDSPARRAINDGCLHSWYPVENPLGGRSGWLVCLNCRSRMRAKKEKPEMVVPRPYNPMTGY